MSIHIMLQNQNIFIWQTFFHLSHYRDILNLFSPTLQRYFNTSDLWFVLSVFQSQYSKRLLCSLSLFFNKFLVLVTLANKLCLCICIIVLINSKFLVLLTLANKLSRIYIIVLTFFFLFFFFFGLPLPGPWGGGPLQPGWGGGGPVGGGGWLRLGITAPGWPLMCGGT
jgi:hypothetical protein